MPIAEDILTKALGEYGRNGFSLCEEDDHTLVLTHKPCGVKDKFTIHASIVAIRNACEDHLTRCKFLNEPNGV